jgi:rSAM/selenodomain-associated transferase 2
MTAPLSIIIPTLNAASDLPICLRSLMPGLTAGLIKELIISDGGSNDETKTISNAAGANFINMASGRGQQLHKGADIARGDWLLFLHADTALSENWIERVDDHIANRPGKAAVFTLKYRSDDRGARWLESRAAWRSKWLALPYGDQGLLISRKLYTELGGFEDVPLMEDVIMARALGRKRIVTLSAEARTSPAKYERDGWHKRGWRNAWLLTRFLLGASPEALAKEYT